MCFRAAWNLLGYLLCGDRVFKNLISFDRGRRVIFHQGLFVFSDFQDPVDYIWSWRDAASFKNDFEQFDVALGGWTAVFLGQVAFDLFGCWFDVSGSAEGCLGLLDLLLWDLPDTAAVDGFFV